MDASSTGVTCQGAASFGHRSPERSRKCGPPSRGRKSAALWALCLVLGCTSSSSNGPVGGRGGQPMGGAGATGTGGFSPATGGAAGMTASGGSLGDGGGAIVADGAADSSGGAVAMLDGSAGLPRDGATPAPDGDGAGIPAEGGGAPVDRAAVLAIMRRVADFELNRFGTTFNNNWVRAAFYTGLMALYGVSADAKYLTAAQSWGQANAWRLGPDSNADPRFADNQACVQTYAELYLLNPVAQNDIMIASGRTVFDQMVAAPRAGRVEWWWCDALFMAPPAVARVAKATGRTQYIDLLHAMWWDTAAFLYDPNQQLFWRDGTFVATNTYWSRGNGWVVAGIARLLDALPQSDARRGDYEGLLRQMAGKLRTIQGVDGFWRSSLMVPSAFPNPESSGTAFFCFGLAWGINQGILERAAYLDTVLRAWQALVFAINAQGQIGWVQPVGAMPGPAALTDTNDYAAGAFLLAGNEMLKL